MVADLLRLKLLLLRNSLRRSTAQLVGVILGGLYGLGLLVLLIIGLVLLGSAEPELIRTILVIGGSATVLGWIVIPIAATGIDMTLDPARFVTFAIPMRQLLAGLVLGGIVGIPGVVTLIASLTQVFTWIRYPAAALTALVCGLVAVLLCVVASRLVTTAVSSMTGSRRFKDVNGIVAFIPLIFLGPIIGGVTAGFQSSPGFARSLADVLAWTPLGALWAAPADVAAGNVGAALLKFLIGAATLALFLVLWSRSLTHALVTPPYNAVSKRAGGNLGWFGRFPATPAGAVAARALTYWLRDPRYSASLVMIPFLAVLLYFSGGGSGTAFAFLGPLTAFLLAWSISADISYDNTAFSLHVSTGVSGRDDRLGRAGALLVFALPIALVFTVVPLLVTGRAEDLPVMLGLSLGLLLTGAGLSSIVSARYTYNVPLPGESAFKTPPGTNFLMFAVQILGWLVLVLLALPEMILTIVYFVTGQALFGWLTVVVGLVLGGVLLVVGIRTGGRWYDRRAPELLLAVSANR
ncbi:transporter [Arthrobacter agilis]|uniref:transporter n=1 Tax=Arthrobacter agilis TaxID=37921 RepID=UPI0027857ACB|nr:transporter [Arthrobacter agilis]MDQ0735413.1 ABC-2 type transport system permease protein [Arthrobacter agilis]